MQRMHKIGQPGDFGTFCIHIVMLNLHVQLSKGTGSLNIDLSIPL